METPPVVKNSAWRLWLFNPFHFLAGGRAMVWGVACIALTAWIGGMFDYRYTGVVSFQNTGPAPLWHAFVQGLLAWVTPSVLLYLGGLAISRSNVRPVDVFGTQALARLPGLLIALIVVSPPVRDVMTSLIVPGIAHLSIPQLALISSVGSVLILLLIWMVLLMYRAFSVSCNVSGGWAIALFVAAIALSEVAAGATGRLLTGTAYPQADVSAPVQSDQYLLAGELAARILQDHELGRFEVLSPEEATEEFRGAFTAEVQRQNHQAVLQQFGSFQGLDYVETRSMENPPHLLIHRFRGTYSAASQAPEVRVVLDRNGKLAGLWIKPWQDRLQ